MVESNVYYGEEGFGYYVFYYDEKDILIKTEFLEEEYQKHMIKVRNRIISKCAKVGLEKEEVERKLRRYLIMP